MLGIYLPTLKRPHRLEVVANNLKEATNTDYALYFCIEPHDEESKKELDRLGLKYFINEYEPSFSNALQTIYENTDEDIFFWANDDFEFVKDWDIEPLKMLKNEQIGVLGVHDGNPNTKYSTISFVRRKYIKEQSGVVDIPNRVLYPYRHNFADDELTLTAKKRGAWDHCTAPCIKHLHPSFTWLEGQPMDDTYKKNDASFTDDLRTYNERVSLFT